MVGRHLFECAICCEGDDPSRYGKGEFGYLDLEPVTGNGIILPPRRIYLCEKHKNALLAVPEDERWGKFQRLRFEEQDGGPQEYVHPVDESEAWDD
jgi:hypothetical protein